MCLNFQIQYLNVTIIESLLKIQILYSVHLMSLLSLRLPILSCQTFSSNKNNVTFYEENVYAINTKQFLCQYSLAKQRKNYIILSAQFNSNQTDSQKKNNNIVLCIKKKS